MPRSRPVAEATVYRLSRYLQCVLRLEKGGALTVLSSDIGRLSGVNAAQVRKDFSQFGQFGRRGVGYNVGELRRHLARILGVDREHRVVIVGAGHLGAALAAYPGFAQRGFRIVGVFDNDPSKVGTSLSGYRIRHLEELPTLDESLHPDIGVIAVPAESAQAVADRMVEASITAILNFAPVLLEVGDRVFVKNVDVTRELECLTYHLRGLEHGAEEGVTWAACSSPTAT